MVEASKFLTVALAAIAGMCAFYYLCLGQGFNGILCMVMVVVLITMHILISESYK
jgi:hypothetical protein